MVTICHDDDDGDDDDDDDDEHRNNVLATRIATELDAVNTTTTRKDCDISV